MNLTLRRGKEYGEATPGELINAGSHLAWTVERPSKPIQEGDPVRIQAGTYELAPFKSPHNGDVLILKNVPNRTYIEVHSANYPFELKGCIAPGLDRGEIVGPQGRIYYVSRSKEALAQLLALTKLAFDKGDKVYLTVEDFNA